MNKRILVLRHMPGERADRVSAWLRTNEFSLDGVNPAHGQPLPSRDEELEYDAMVIYGGVQSVNDVSLDYMNDERAMIQRWLEADRPVLGLCLGGQLIAQVLGARVQNHPQGRHEVGYVPIAPAAGAEDFLSETTHFYQWHNEGFELPQGARPLATGEVYPNQAFTVGSNTYGFQFHPEVTPELVEIWNSEVESSRQDVAGADPVPKQISDAARFNPAVDTWTHEFLRRWTDAFARG